MITPEENQACKDWLQGLLKERLGPPKPPNLLGMTTYPAGSAATVLQSLLPGRLVAKIQALAGSVTGFYWEELDEAELGTIMKAGAAEFLPMVTENP